MTKSEAKELALPTFNNDDLATSVFFKYSLLDDNNDYKEFSLKQMFNRLIEPMNACERDVFKSDVKFDTLFENFIFAGRILYALGNPYDTTSTYSNCYVTEIDEDNIESIFETAKKQARVFSKGGGIGFDISKLRPKGARVNNSAKTTSGSVSFMDLFSLVTGLIGQHGRRGALMLSISVKHPDLLDFIRVKGGADKTKVQYANISVRITDDFMNALINNADWEMEYVLKDGTKYTTTESASFIWSILVESNRVGAEPGILFWDNILKYDPAAVFDETRPISTNPCAEEPLEKGGACVLGSVNLNTFVINSFQSDAEFDFVAFDEAVRLAVRALDNIVELNLSRQPLEENRIAARLGRRIGLGFTGMADMLIRMGLVYDSDEAIDFVSRIMKVFKQTSIEASIDLAVERGPFDLLNTAPAEKIAEFKSHSYYDELSDEYRVKFMKYGIRNVGINTVAPNGSISIILRTSSGLEPIFRTEYDRTVMQGSETSVIYTTYHPLVLEYDAIYGKNAHKQSPLFVTSDKIDWVKRVKMQAAIQRHISQSISSTINLPKGTTAEQISTIYVESWKQGLKGVTVYVDKSRDGVLNEKSEVSQSNNDVAREILSDVKTLTEGDSKYKLLISEKRKWHCHYELDEFKMPSSLFIATNSAEKTILVEGVIVKLDELARTYNLGKYADKIAIQSAHQSNVDKVARMLGLLLRHRIPIQEICNAIDSENPPIYSLVFQLKKFLLGFLDGITSGETCPKCGGEVVYEGGCKICRGCGESKCG